VQGQTQAQQALQLSMQSQHAPPVSNSILCTSPRPRGAMRRNSITCARRQDGYSQAPSPDVRHYVTFGLQGLSLGQQGKVLNSKPTRGPPQTHTPQPALPLPLTFTMAPLTEPIQRNRGTLPPNRMYLWEVGSRWCQREGTGSWADNQSWSNKQTDATASHADVQSAVALVWTSLYMTWLQVLRPGSPGLGGTRGRLRHIPPVQQLEAHRLARLLSLPPRVGTLGGRGGWQEGMRSVGG